MTTKEILTRLVDVHMQGEIDYAKEYNNDYQYGDIAFSGLKRLYYGLWHDGCNEKGEDMCEHMSYREEIMYLNLMEQVRELSIPEPVLIFTKPDNCLLRFKEHNDFQDEYNPQYTIVTWPASQELMDKPWFDQCYLINDEKGLDDFGSSAYFVPTHLLKQL